MRRNCDNADRRAADRRSKRAIARCCVLNLLVSNVFDATCSARGASGLLTDGEQKELDEKEDQVIDQRHLLARIQHIVCVIESSAPPHEALFERKLLEKS
jgi:hypothetical protein